MSVEWEKARYYMGRVALKVKNWKIAIIALIACIAIVIWNMIDNDEMHISKEEMKRYMQIVDETSVGKTQVNWKEVAVVSVAENDGDFGETSNEEIAALAKQFIKQKGQKYQLKSLEEVLHSHNLSWLQERKIADYQDYLLNDVVYSHKTNEELNKNFIGSIKEAAIDNYEQYGVLPSITISQAILESDWGRSQLAADYNNLFGIKDHKKWDGKTASLNTKEFYDQKIVANFRAYDDISQSVNDHGLFLKENPRYKKNGLFSSITYSEQAKALENAGYSTMEDENGNKMYSKVLIQLIQQYELQLIDHIVYLAQS